MGTEASTLALFLQICFTLNNQYASSPGRRAHSYAELAISSPAVAETTAGTHCTYPSWDG